MNSKVVLVDGHSILNRAFYGVPDLTNHEGLHTNAIYGFLNILFKIMDEEKPDYLVVAFDRKEPTFRHEMFEAYKGTRKSMPDELREQVPIMKEVLLAMGILIVEKAGLEADDILGTLAKEAEKKGHEVSLVSGDRDLLQIATNHIKIRIPKSKGGKTTIEDYYEEDVVTHYQVTPEQFIELKALMGDTADNIPGVPKVGEKTATNLMVTYGSIDGIYEHIEEITKKSIHDTLIENKELAILSKALATIKIDCELPVQIEDAKIGQLFTKEAYEYFQRLEFKNLLKKFEDTEKQENTQVEIVLLSSKEELEDTLPQVINSKLVGFSVLSKESSCVDAASFAFEDKVIVFFSKDFEDQDYITQKVKWTLDTIIEKQGQLATFAIKKAYPFLDGKKTELLFDVQIASYLLNPLKNDYEIDDVAREQLQDMIPSKEELFGKKDVLLSEDYELLKNYLGNMAYVSKKAMPILTERLEVAKMLTLFRNIEMPLSYVLYQMETEGILVNKEALVTYGENLTGIIEQLRKDIYALSEVEFNINSPKQLGEILFERMQLPGGKKTKTGYSTSAEVLDKLAPDYEIVAKVLEYRAYAKLKSTYAEGLLTCIKEDGRIHTTLNQTITATGRISSTEPNLQNIPMKMEMGRKIRKAFVPKEGYVFADADYSQIELRILAHMSNDQKLIEAYRTDQDIHRITASEVFHTPLEEVTDLQRRNAKAVNFGIVYGISSFGLSQDLSISRKEATQYIDQYFATYPNVKGFLEDLVKEAKENGYITTLFGRRRPVPELQSSNFMQRSFGERIAMNSPIQGTAADIIKIAMIQVYRALEERKLKSKLILQIHDELLIETAVDEVDVVREILETEMKKAAELSVDLVIDAHVGKDWFEVK